MSRITPEVAQDIQYIKSSVSELSTVMLDLAAKLDILTDLMMDHNAINKTSPTKLIGRGKLTKTPKGRKNEPDDDDESKIGDELTSAALQATQTTQPVESKPVKSNKAPVKIAVDEPQEFDIKKSAKVADIKKKAPFNKLTVFTKINKADPNRFNAYFTPEVKALVENDDSLKGLTGNDLDKARNRLMYDTAVAKFPYLFEELRKEYDADTA
jgi:hypothetical protein